MEEIRLRLNVWFAVLAIAGVQSIAFQSMPLFGSTSIIMSVQRFPVNEVIVRFRAERGIVF